MSRGTKRIALVAALAVAGLGIAALAGVARPDAAHGGTDGVESSGITVTGSAAVKAVPDTAQFTFGVESQAETSTAALQANSEAVSAVIAAIKNAGVSASDIQTQQVSISPRYSENGQKIVGYTATNSVTVTIRDLAKAGAVVEAATAAGANQVYGPTFSISEQTDLYKQALQKALADAKDKATTIAAAAGVSLGRVIAIVEGTSVGGPIPLAEGAAADQAVPIEPGTQDIAASLTVTYAIG